MIVQILRFTLPSSATISAPSFRSLRRRVAAVGADSQYFGYSVPLRRASLPKKRHQITWVIEWPEETRLYDGRSVLQGLHDVSQDDATELLVTLGDDQRDTFFGAIHAPVCEIVAMRVLPEAPVSEADFEKSMHKTYTDCYRMQGFVEGSWAYAYNTNATEGCPMSKLGENPIITEHGRLGIYFLGWESIELHEDASTTDVFKEEMDKLAPWLDRSSGAWYITFRKDGEEQEERL